MSLHSSALLAVLIVLLAAAGITPVSAAPGSLFWGNCTQGDIMLAMSPDPTKFLLGSSRHMGQGGYCEFLGDQYCVMYVKTHCVPKNKKKNATERFTNKCTGITYAPAYGFCVPSEAKGCTEKILNDQAKLIETLVPNVSAAFQAVWGPGSRCSTIDKDDDDCSFGSYAYTEVECKGNRESLEDDSGAYAVFIFAMMLVSFSLLCTLLVYLDDMWHDIKKAVRGDDEGNERTYMVSPNGNPISMEEAKLLNRDSPPPSSGGGVKNKLYSAPDCHDPQMEKEEERANLLSPRVRHYAEWWDLIGSFTRFATPENRSHGDYDTRFFEGLRVIAMLFVIYGHVAFFPDAVAGFMDPKTTQTFIKSYTSIGVFPALLAVDTFFYLSGFLFMHLYVKHVEKVHVRNGGVLDHDDPNDPIRPLGFKKTGMMIVHRYFRLTPVVMLTLVFSVWLFPYISNSGVMHRLYSHCPVFTDCKTQWWHQLLYINNMNYGAHWDTCMGWFWYLSCDMQLFVVACIIAPLWYLDRRLFFLLCTGGIATGIGIMAHYEGYTETQWYHKTYMRYVPYFYGLVGALFVRNDTIKRNMKRGSIRFFFYFVGAALMVSSINVMWKVEANLQSGNKSLTKFTNGWCTFAWGLGLNFFACVWTTPHGGLIKRFLSHGVFIVLSKLTFTCYMLHPIVLMTKMALAWNFPEFEPTIYYYEFGGALVCTFFSALWLYLIVEYPLSMVNNAITKRFM